MCRSRCHGFLVDRIGIVPVRLLLANPNTNTATTDRMVEIARDAAPEAVEIIGTTAEFGASLITTPEALEVAADWLCRRIASIDLASFDGLIVAAFGDPALDRLRAAAACPVTGIAEAAIMEAARDDRRFAIVTTTPDLVGSISALISRYGFAGNYAGAYLTAADPHVLMRDPDELVAQLAACCTSATADGAEAVIIGGGPLASAARRIAAGLEIPVIEPIPCAVKLALERAAGAV